MQALPSQQGAERQLERPALGGFPSSAANGLQQNQKRQQRNMVIQGAIHLI